METRSYHFLLTTASSLLLILTGTVICYETYYIEEKCTKTGNLTIPLVDGGEGSAVFLKSTIHTSYSIAMDCRIEIVAPSAHRIMVSVLEIGFRVYPTGICKDYIQIDKAICKDIFRLDEERHYLSSDNTMQLMYHVSKDGLNNSTFSYHPGIKLTVTALKEGRNCRSSDYVNWFKCDNGYCIWSGLKCDSHNNCGDLSDEQDCGSSGGSSTVLIILGGLILLLMVIMCVATLMCSKNETVRRFSNRLRSRTLSYIPKFSR